LELTYKRFNFATTVPNNWWSRLKWRPKVQDKAFTETAIVRATVTSVPQVQRSFGIVTFYRQTHTIAWASFVKIARNSIGLTLFGAISLVSAVFVSRIIMLFGIPLLPTTQQG